MMNLDSLFTELAESLLALQRSVVLLLPRLLAASLVLLGATFVA
jgi:hypothetical protein